MSFLAAGRLWLLLAVVGLAAAYVVGQVRRKDYAVRFTNLALLDKVAPRRPGWRRHVPAVAMLLALATMVTAFARPARPVRVPRERATVVMAIDVSLSMEAVDVAPRRIDAAVAAATSFVDLVPARINLGLVTFSGVTSVLVAPTKDHSMVKQGLTRMQLGPRTAIGDAVLASLGSIASVPAEAGQGPAPARIVLMSDGETTVGAPNETAAAAANDAHVPVSTIAFGTDAGVVNVEGGQVRVPVNHEALRALAEATGGQSFEAATEKELARVYADIGSSVGYTEGRREVTSGFVGLALAFAVAAAAGSLVWFSRLP
ncbi:MAG: VWA domain-containing protein [Acidimicrobiales bacterium]